MSHDSTPDTSGEVDIEDMLSDTVLFVLRWLRTLIRIEGEDMCEGGVGKQEEEDLELVKEELEEELEDELEEELGDVVEEKVEELV